MDFITGLQKSNWFDTIFEVVDCLMKYAHFISASHPYTAKDIVDIFAKVAWLP